MTTINLEPYTHDTLKNLKKILRIFSDNKISLEKYKSFIDSKYSDSNNKKVLFIGGSQISGSVSPFMHSYSSFINSNPFSYLLFDMTKENINLKNVFNFINENTDILGANITMPYKIEIFKLLQDVGTLDESAKLVGAVNTIGKIDGKITGINTDLYGILKPIEAKFGKKISTIKKGYILGAGGAARAAVGALLKLGIKDITIFNRSEEKLLELKKHFYSDEIKKIVGNNFKISIVKYFQNDDNNNSIKEHIDEKGIMINTLPLGFNKNLPLFPILEKDIDKVFENINLYFDIVYSLDEEYTPMEKYIKENYSEIVTCDGIDMVVKQAKKGFDMWSNGDTFHEKQIRNILKIK